MIVAAVVSWLNWDERSVWVMRAISEEAVAVGSRTLTCTMSPALAPAQNGHAAG